MNDSPPERAAGGSRSHGAAAPTTVPFIDLRAQYHAIRAGIDAAVARVLESGVFVLGPEVAAFEKAFAEYIGVRECVCVNSGTAAVQLALTGAGLEEGDEVIIPANTFFATAEGVLWAGGKPVFVDVLEDDANLDPQAIEDAVTPRTRFIVPVHLYGQPARLAEIRQIARRKNLILVEDACQAHGAELEGRRVGSFGRTAAFSFYPGKNLGAYGEGGAIVTDDPDIAARCRSLRDHGQVRKYDHAVVGHNFRLEALQGAVLAAKLPYLDRWNEARRAAAQAYRTLLSGLPVQPFAERPGVRHVYHLFVVRSANRDALQAFLRDEGIETLVHYPVPLHRQRALAHLGYEQGAFPVTEKLAREIVSLPIYPEIGRDAIQRVADAIGRFASGGR